MDEKDTKQDYADHASEDAEVKGELEVKFPAQRHRLGGKMGLISPKRVAEDTTEQQGKTDMENKELEVLDPDHPLMKRFQKGLKEHLLKLNEEANLQLHELNKAIQDQEKGKEDLGAQLYGLQKELLHQKEILDILHEKYKMFAEKKEDITSRLEEVKNSHKLYNENLVKERKKELELQKQMEELALQLVQLSALQTDSSGDEKIVKCAAEKASKVRTDLEIEKLRQDLLIVRYEETRHQLQDKISCYKAQCTIKKEEASDLRKELTEANAEMQTVQFEKQQLVNQWKFSLAALQRRDETCSTLRDTVRVQEDDICTLNMEILGHKKSVRKELERNEKLTLQLQQREADIARLKNSIKDSKTRQQALQQEYSFYDHTVHETDKALESLKLVKTSKEKEMKEKANQLEKAYCVRRELEDKLMEKLHEKITFNKATKYTKNIVKTLRDSMEKLEQEITSKENELARVNLDLINTRSNIQTMEQTLEHLNAEIRRKDTTITRSEAEIVKGHNLIEKKQLAIAELNRKLEILISGAGGMELGPLEREISNVKKETAASEHSRKCLEQEWLRFQGELVALTNESSVQLKEINTYYKRLAVLEEKKIRIEADISKEEKEINEIDHRIGCFRNDITHLNGLLYEEKGLQEKLQQDTELLKGDFANALKKAELDCLQKENEVKCRKKEKEKLRCLLTEAQREVALWEVKLQLVEDTRKTLKSDTLNDEIAEYKGQIKRLRLTLTQIQREQEDLIQQMEKAVLNHATLYTKLEIQSVRGPSKKSMQYLEKKTEALKKKIKQDKKVLAKCHEQIEYGKEAESELTNKIEQQNEMIPSLMTEIDMMDQDTENKKREKFTNLVLLSLKQKKTKYYHNIKDDKYVAAVKKEENRSAEIEKVKTNIGVIHSIIEVTAADYPELTKEFQKTTDALALVVKF